MTARQRKLLTQLQSRHGRRKSDLLICEGARCCREALARQPQWLEFAVCNRSLANSDVWPRMLAPLQARTAADVQVVPDEEFARLAVTENPQGVLLVLRRPAGADVREPVPALPPPGLLLILDRVQEPGNLGTILRTAWAVGLGQVWYTDGTTDPFGPKAVRAGMGAQFAIGLRALPDLPACAARLAAAGVDRLWRAVPSGGISCFSPEFELRRSAVTIGNEASGIRDGDTGRPVTIPMPGKAESLNAAQAATILLFEAVRRGLFGLAT